jgi:solute carrier family 25, member 39/40
LIDIGYIAINLTEKPNERASTTREIIRRIYVQRGLPGLFSGLVPRVIKVAPACAVMISSYEYGKLFFGRYNQKRLASQSLDV